MRRTSETCMTWKISQPKIRLLYHYVLPYRPICKTGADGNTTLKILPHGETTLQNQCAKCRCFVNRDLFSWCFVLWVCLTTSVISLLTARLNDGRVVFDILGILHHEFGGFYFSGLQHPSLQNTKRMFRSRRFETTTQITRRIAEGSWIASRSRRFPGHTPLHWYSRYERRTKYIDVTSL